MSPNYEAAVDAIDRQLSFITHHQAVPSALNDNISIVGFDVGAGGANTSYTVHAGEHPTNLTFHTGNPADGVKGISNEALLAVLIDRLEGFQSGRFASRQNETILGHLRNALSAMDKRTETRTDAGTVGTQETTKEVRWLAELIDNAFPANVYLLFKPFDGGLRAELTLNPYEATAFESKESAAETIEKALGSYYADKWKPLQHRFSV
jgi:hypothetical protein